MQLNPLIAMSVLIIYHPFESNILVQVYKAKTRYWSSQAARQKFLATTYTTAAIREASDL